MMKVDLKRCYASWIMEFDFLTAPYQENINFGTDGGSSGTSFLIIFHIQNGMLV